MQNVTWEKSLIYFLIIAIVATFGFLIYLFGGQATKSIQITYPVGSEEWKIGETYKIAWKARGISRVGIVLFKGQEPKWIAKNVNAASGSYDYKVEPGQQFGDDYWISVFEYPWQKGNKVAYSSGAIAVVYSDFSGCDAISVQNSWPYVPSDIQTVRRVFITDATFSGNLEGLQGADRRCQEEADSKGYKGTWRAFIGGDEDNNIAIARLNATPRKTDGIFVSANPESTLSRGATCHRLFAKDFNDFMTRFSDLSLINEKRFGADFLQNFGNIWLGRVDDKSKKNCTTVATIFADPYRPLQEKYSLTTTCQNWTIQDKAVSGYPVPSGTIKPPFPTCYTPQGRLTDAVSLSGLATGVETGAFTAYQGKTCDTKQHLFCIEE